MELKNFTCPNCGASVPANPNLDTVTCNMCGTPFAIEQDTAKLAINKISGIANKMIDNREKRIVEEREYRRGQQKEAEKDFWKYILFMLAIPIIFAILNKIGLF